MSDSDCDDLVSAEELTPLLRSCFFLPFFSTTLLCFLIFCFFMLSLFLIFFAFSLYVHHFFELFSFLFLFPHSTSYHYFSYHYGSYLSFWSSEGSWHCFGQVGYIGQRSFSADLLECSDSCHGSLKAGAHCTSSSPPGFPHVNA